MSKIKSLLFVPNTANGAGWGLFLLRIGLAVLMIPHGYSKLNKLLSGDIGDFPDPLGVTPTVSLALTVFAEFVCSILLLCGAFTRFAAGVLIFCMLVIAFKVHWADPLGDKEHALLYGFGYLALFFAGPGKFSVDERLG